MLRKLQLDYARAVGAVRREQEWIAKCGGNLSGYIATYGRASDPKHHGDGAELIYRADLTQLAKVTARRDEIGAKLRAATLRAEARRA